ncbi:MAG: hypothetical protein QM770_03235 [Tepidisphaeraceae bacterium]
MKPGCLPMILLALLGVCVFGLNARAEDHAGHAAHAAPAQAAFTGDPYPLATDPVTGEALPDKPIIDQAATGEVRFASAESQAKFKADPKTYEAKIEKAIIEQQSKDYALEICPGSGEKLGGMGEPTQHVFGNRLIKFCCDGCPDDVKKDLKAAFDKQDAAIIAKQKPTYALTTCPVSGEKLDDKAIDVVLGSKLIRLCCKDCVEELHKHPAKVLAKVNEASAK